MMQTGSGKVSWWSGSAARPPLSVLQQRLGVEIDEGMLELALTHRSYAFEHGGIADNERLEFLGDAILGQAVTIKLYQDYPELAEGELARRRAGLVSAVALAEVAHTVDLGVHIRFGRGERLTGGAQKQSILADTLEAVLGAVYLCAGGVAATELVLRLLSPIMSDPERYGVKLDPKTALQELVARQNLPAPEYTIEQTGPDHQRSFVATVRVGDRATGSGAGTSKKLAEMAAALTAWHILNGK